MLTVTQAAKKAQVAPNTARKYVNVFSDLFSEDARGLHGNRQFNDDDVATLCSLFALKDAGMPLAEAADRLRTQEAPSLIDVVATQASTDVQAGQDASFALQVVQSSVQPQLDALRAEISAQQRDIAMLVARQTTGANQLIAGILIGFALALLLAGLLLRGG
jgi:DNA-binding transcriptional MerR regulator